MSPTSLPVMLAWYPIGPVLLIPFVKTHRSEDALDSVTVSGLLILPPVMDILAILNTYKYLKYINRDGIYSRGNMQSS